jgi:Domain of unknown function DUF11/CARDB
MSRSATVIITGLIVVALVAAILPAQESSHRTAAGYGSFPDLTATADAPYASASPVVYSPPTEFNNGPPTEGQAAFQEPARLPQASAYEAAAPAALEPPPNSLPVALAAIPQESPSGGVAPPPLPFPSTASFTTSSEPASSQTAAAPAEPPANDDGQLRSVLKHSRTPAAQEPPAAAPPAPQPANTSGVPSSRRTQPVPAPSLPRPAATTTASPRSDTRSIQDLAVTGKSASLRVEMAGPQGITVGKPAAYVINVLNESDVPADEVLVRLALPARVTVSGTQPSTGEAALQADSQGPPRLVWTLPRVAARSREQLRLRLVAVEGDEVNLGLEWTCKPASAKATLVVKQPKLEMSLAGAADMTFGEEKVFTLSVSNPGSGDAERVMVSVSSGNGPPQQIEVGSIPAGFKKELSLQIVASQPGEMELRAVATGEGELKAETSGKIMVRKAEVQVAVQGPPLKFAGAEASYVVTVVNSGSAAADSVNLLVTLPAGAKYLGGIEGATAGGNSLKWKIASLPAGGERTYELKMQLVSAGLNRLVVQSQTNAGGSTTAQAETQVEAVSDLKLVVNDPSGPLPVDEQATYNVQVVNRGSQAAQRVKIVVQFSSGVEPISFDGCEARIVPGQVLCQPLAQLGAGEQVTLRIKAKAHQVGTHQFRVEVTSADGDARLVSEGTTRFFSESGSLGSAATTAGRPALLPTPGPLKR